MNSISVSVKIVVTIIVLTAAVLLSLAVFGALDYSEIKDNLVRLGLVGLIVIASSTVISIVNQK